jgi:hypothetical protein
MLVGVPPEEWKSWIGQGSHDLLRPLPAGSLNVKTIHNGSGDNNDSDAPPPGALLSGARERPA